MTAYGASHDLERLGPGIISGADFAAHEGTTEALAVSHSARLFRQEKPLSSFAPLGYSTSTAETSTAERIPEIRGALEIRFKRLV